MTPLMKALMANLSILAMWYLSEYAQFGELQLDRKCDDLVFVLYFLLTWAMFRTIDKNDMQKNKEDRET